VTAGQTIGASIYFIGNRGCEGAGLARRLRLSAEGTDVAACSKARCSYVRHGMHWMRERTLHRGATRVKMSDESCRTSRVGRVDVGRVDVGRVEPRDERAGGVPGQALVSPRPSALSGKDRWRLDRVWACRT
jgi:hypothetical protein